jgi:hypothetical protein
MFRKLVLSLAAAAGMVAQFVLPAEAGMDVGAFAPRAALVESSPVEQAQFVWGGRRYCWYNSAWRHPGFVHRPVHRPPVHRPPVHRPGSNRPGHNRPPAHRPGGGQRRS